jgi:hypothetical protein
MGEHEASREDEPEKAPRSDQEIPGDLEAPELGGGMGDDHDGVELFVHVDLGRRAGR